MKFGICTDIEGVSEVKKAGFDYIELKAYDVALAGEEKFWEIQRELAMAGLPCEAVNFFYPPSLSVVGPQIDKQQISSYIGRALERCERLGVRMITVGSSKSRRIPDGFSEREAREQFSGQLYQIGERAKAFGAVVAIEPIRPSSTNFINTIAQAAEVCRMTGHPAVRVMADYYQMYGAGDNVEEIAHRRELICHLHTIELERKCYPVNLEDDGQIALFQAYGGERASIEGADFTDVDTAAAALKAMRHYEELGAKVKNNKR